MGYRHTRNLYAEQTILLFKECYALEKIHGTSAHVTWNEGVLTFSSGGSSPVAFKALFDEADLIERFTALGHAKVTVYGEAYGGKQQAQAWRYGPHLKFVAFEIQVGETWLAVPDAADVTYKLGLEFVHYEKISTDLAAIDRARDSASMQAIRNGVEGFHPREGVVLRPLKEFVDSSGDRVMAKHKRDDERETATPRVVEGNQVVLDGADAIAMEWVTDTRLEHVLDKLPTGIGMESTPAVISAMIEDVLREGAGEIVDSKPARKAIGQRAAKLFHAKVKAIPNG